MKFFILTIVLIYTNCQVALLTPGVTMNNRLKYNETAIFQVNANELKPNQFYKVMVHYLGSVITHLLSLVSSSI
jgi:hypothetical protein